MKMNYIDSTPQEFGATAEAAPSTPEPSSAPAEEDEGANDLMSALTRSKKKKTAKEEAKAAEERADEDAKVQLKSKKRRKRKRRKRRSLRRSCRLRRRRPLRRLLTLLSPSKEPKLRLLPPPLLNLLEG